MKKYLTYLLLKNRTLGIVLTILFFFVHPIWIIAVSMNGNQLAIEETFYLRNLSMFAIMLLIIVIHVIPLIILRKQMSIRGSDLIHSLPIKKEIRTFTEIIGGWLICFIPFILSCLCVLLLTIKLISLEYCIELGFIFIYQVFIMSAWYLFNCYISCKCNSLRDAIIVEILYLTIFILFLIQIGDFFYAYSINYHVANNVGVKAGYILQFASPITALITIQAYGLLSFYLPIIYCIYGILFIIAIRISIRNRKSEDCGSVSESKILYSLPLSIILIILLITYITPYYSYESVFGIYLFLFICYLCVCFIAQRNFKLRGYHILMFVICVLFSISLRLVYIKTACFTFAYQYRNMQDTKEIRMELNTFNYDEENMEPLLEYVDSSEETLKNIKEATLKIQDYLVQEYVEGRGVNRYFIRGNDEGYVSVMYANGDVKDNEIQEFKYYLNEENIARMNAILEEHHIEWNEKYQEYQELDSAV